jgi:hypothetical protein
LDIALKMGGIMVKKKLTPVVLLCYLLIGLNGCGYVLIGALTAGAGAGAYFFVQGNLKRDYEAPVERMWEATLKSRV